VSVRHETTPATSSRQRSASGPALPKPPKR
jgi:hypothetical protein